jgi:sugar phosphate isomerase/epimerase
MQWARRDWSAQVAEASRVSTYAIELSVRSEKLLSSLCEFLESSPELPFRYLSIHGPAKYRRLAEDDLVRELRQLARRADAIVMHPDTLERPERYRALGSKLVLENMDARKAWGRTPEELAAAFERLPDAGFCLDIAHAWSIEHDPALADQLLARFNDRLRHVHVSSLSSEFEHEPLRGQDERRFLPILERCKHVPWILEAPLPS